MPYRTNLAGDPAPRTPMHPWILPLTVRQAFVVAAVLAICMLVVGYLLPAVRVGDGSEYYGLYLALKETHRPFMTEQAFQAYDQLLQSHHVAELAGTTGMRNAFPPLVQGDTADFNHFWFYPALAWITGSWLDALGAGPHGAFLFLHAWLFAALLIVSGRAFGRLGVVAALLVTFGSPMVWFFNKVHTEFFTYCLVAIATTYFVRRNYFAAAVALAAASTQNISLGAVGMFALALGAWQAGWLRLTIRRRHVALALLAMALVGIHPLYYLWRVGVIDPQLLAGGAKIGTNAGSALIWLFDPDVGLVPNWPLSLVILAMGAVAMRRQGGLSWPTIVYVAVFLVTNLYAQASTQNLNSGATIYIARYATWYIGLFVPALGYGLLGLRDAAAWLRIALALLLGVAAVANAVVFRPTRHETYMEPTSVSRQLQLHLPDAYDPPPQIFSERFSGTPIGSQSIAAFGPDCKKVIVVEKTGSPVMPVPSKRCNYDLSALPERVLRPTQWQGTIPDGRRYVYLHLSDAERKAAYPALRTGVRYKPTASDLRTTTFLTQGWYAREDLGLWTRGDHARIEGAVAACPASGLRLFLTVTPHLSAKNPRIVLGATVGQHDLGKRTLTKGETVAFDIPCDALNDGKLAVDLRIDGWMSPLDAGVSTDWRELGLFLSEFWFEPAS